MELVKKGLAKSIYSRKLKYGAVYAVAENVTGDVEVYPALNDCERVYSASEVAAKEAKEVKTHVAEKPSGEGTGTSGKGVEKGTGDGRVL